MRFLTLMALAHFLLAYDAMAFHVECANTRDTRDPTSELIATVIAGT